MNWKYELTTEVILVIYSVALLFLFCYGFVQLHLVYQYLKNKKKIHPKISHSPLGIYPFVTVQLPVYNESIVVERLIDAVTKFDYPKDKCEIQILDDSTDETTAIIAQKIRQNQTSGLQIHHIHRSNRKGYKAGALQNGLSLAKGEFIAIFDADFVPPPDFLQRTLPYFQNKNVGMVQTRWAHLNKNNSLLTHFQAFLLDAHFSVEQKGRNEAGCFINFSGTGGVWRKACMQDAGGWHTDTLTEDFDLSYRAQLKGWQFMYLEDVTVPAELPPLMSALKAQQFRWIKGNAETARKHVKTILRSPLPTTKKVHAFFHLTVGFVFISAFLASFLSIPLLMLKPHVPHLKAWFGYASFSLISLLCLGVFHYIATVRTGFIGSDAKRYFFKTFPLYLSFSMGMAFNNAVAVAEGWLGIKSSFVRTPKFNALDDKKTKSLSSSTKLFTPFFVIELLLMIYFLCGAMLAFYYHDFSMFPYHLMLAFGFAMIVWFTMKERFDMPSVFRAKPKKYFLYDGVQV